MNMILGADGCKKGWIAITRDLDTGSVNCRVYCTARELLYSQPTPQIIALDIPIGLPEQGPRACDLEARKRLGWPRACSVFPAPIRRTLTATSYEDACQIRYKVENKKMSRQAYGILRKIREVDEVLRQNSELRMRVHEVHPEISFYFLAGQRPLKYSKKIEAGREERRKLLEPVFGQWLQTALKEHKEQPKELPCAEDDLLDAFIALWTSERIFNGKSQTIPAVPPQDACGLRMEMVA
jgi:predicted RNase H-like nuclease